MHAAAELLAERAYADLTMEAVADRAGVSKPALYRRWPNLVHLAFAVHARATMPDELPDTGTFTGDLRVLLGGLVDQATRIDRDLLADQCAEMIRDPAFADTVRTATMDPLRDRAAQVYARARDRGEVRDDLDPREVMRDVSSVAVLRIALLHQSPDEQMLDTFLDRFVHGVLAR